MTDYTGQQKQLFSAAPSIGDALCHGLRATSVRLKCLQNIILLTDEVAGFVILQLALILLTNRD